MPASNDNVRGTGATLRGSVPADQRLRARRAELSPCPESAKSCAAERAEYDWYQLRSAQYDAIYLSPHMDDAVYSCGGQMLLRRAKGERVLVITVFGNGPDAAPAQRGDIFRDLVQRKREELAAMEQLDVDFLFLNLPDGLHRKHSASELVRFVFPFLSLAPGEMHTRLLTSLQALFTRLLAPSGHALFPLAVGHHPDHRIVFDVGREMHASGQYDVSFYEDVAYVHVTGMLQDRLRNLGIEVRLPFFSFVNGVQRMVWRRAPLWKQYATWPLTFAFLLLRWLLQWVSGLADRRPGERDPSVSETDISAALDRKVAAMRAYATQTAYFFPPGEALVGELLRSGERFVERCWRYPPPLSPRPLIAPCAALHPDIRKVEALVAELRADVTTPPSMQPHVEGQAADTPAP